MFIDEEAVDSNGSNGHSEQEPAENDTEPSDNDFIDDREDPCGHMHGHDVYRQVEIDRAAR